MRLMQRGMIMLIKSITGRSIGISTVLVSLVLSFVLFASHPALAAPAPSCAVTAPSDMVITKTAPATTSVGGQISYQLTVTNMGPNDATNVTVSDTLPAGTTFVTSSTQLVSGTAATGGSAPVVPAPGTPGPALLSANASVWPNGTSYTFTIVVNATQVGAISNTATVTANCDPDLTNNSSAASTNVTPAQVPTMNEWGMIIFLMLAGLGSLYYLRRNRAES